VVVHGASPRVPSNQLQESARGPRKRVSRRGGSACVVAARGAADVTCFARCRARLRPPAACAAAYHAHATATDGLRHPRGPSQQRDRPPGPRRRGGVHPISLSAIDGTLEPSRAWLFDRSFRPTKTAARAGTAFGLRSRTGSAAAGFRRLSRKQLHGERRPSSRVGRAGARAPRRSKPRRRPPAMTPPFGRDGADGKGDGRAVSRPTRPARL
jgi:hypothetical protein